MPKKWPRRGNKHKLVPPPPPPPKLNESPPTLGPNSKPDVLAKPPPPLPEDVLRWAIRPEEWRCTLDKGHRSQQQCASAGVCGEACFGVLVPLRCRCGSARCSCRVSFRAQGSHVKVTLTRCRQVSKPAGAKPGLVRLSGAVQTVTVDMKAAEERLQRLDASRK